MAHSRKELTVALRRQRPQVRILSGAPAFPGTLGGVSKHLSVPRSASRSEWAYCPVGRRAIGAQLWIGRSAASSACSRAKPSASVLPKGSSHKVTSAAPSSRASTSTSTGYFARAASSGGR